MILLLDTQHITQHKRFVPYGTHPNFRRAKTSFMLGTLGEIASPFIDRKIFKEEKVIKHDEK